MSGELAHAERQDRRVAASGKNCQSSLRPNPPSRAGARNVVFDLRHEAGALKPKNVFSENRREFVI